MALPKPCLSVTCERTFAGCKRCELRLPPGPYEYATTAPLDGHHGIGHVYLLDANGRKIAALWGKPGEKMALVELMTAMRDLVTAANFLADDTTVDKDGYPEIGHDGRYALLRLIEALGRVNEAQP